MTASSRAVSPSDIQRELNRIWESLETTNVARACLFNLIFYTEENVTRTPYIQRIAQKVVEKFPSRVIFVTVDKKSEENFLKTEVSILSSSKGEFDVACDYISIQAGGTSQNQVPFVVLPHILPDLPVYLVWGEDPGKGDPLRDQLEQLASRLIFDSESTDDLPRFASSLLELKERSLFAVADLNWARIESWREMLSLAFYSKDNLEKIQRSQTIHMTYNAQESPFFCHTDIQAIYLQAWLACQLGWKFQKLSREKEGLRFLYEGLHGSIEVLFSSTEQAQLPPGLILSVDIATREEEHFCFKRNLNMLHQITLQSSTREQCTLPSHYIFTKAESGHSLVKEICHRGTSEHFCKVLTLVKQMDVICAR
jgi:glucose-6-phosphate dehydrogenase assembly protein OpcA